MLGHVRVLDLSDERGQLCGQILADLGAEVIAVEPPGGSAVRGLEPFAGDRADSEHSLWWWSLNRNKKSVVIGLDSEQGREQFRSLAATADIVLETFEPGYLDSLGAGYDALSKINPALTLVSLTAFGQSGPKAGWAATDLAVFAASGVLQFTGDHDRAPCSIHPPQAFFQASIEGAVAALIAHRAAVRDGAGQHVDVSAQAATALCTQALGMAAVWNEAELQRFAGGLRLGPLKLRVINPCKDGFVSVTFLFGNAIGPFSRRLMEVLCEEGFVDEVTRDKDWCGFGMALLTGDEPVSELDRCIECITRFTMSHTKAELFRLALERRLLIVPVATVEDLVRSEQLAARDFWRQIHQPQLGREITCPGPFARFSATPLKEPAAAPGLGEHTTAVLGSLEPRPRARPRGDAPGDLPPALAGLRVLDFMWVMAGPVATRYLADFGATVVHVESAKHIDTARTGQPFKDSIPGPERSGLFALANAGKLGITLDLAQPAARAVVMDLVRWADVVTESFTPGTLKSLGLDYDSLRAVNPSIVMLSSCLSGQFGPQASLAGFGSMGHQLAGFGEMVGWPDRQPAGPFGAYTDYVSPRIAAASILAALEHRRLTGEGQYIDLSQAEAGIQMLGPAVLEYTVNGRIPRRDGNASRRYAPHGVFPAAGDDRWVAVAARDDADFRALCLTIGHPGLADDPRFRTNSARLENREVLEARIAEWTCQRDAGELEEVLQVAAVPAHRSSTSADFVADPQLHHRGHFVTVNHPEMGPIVLEGPRSLLSRTPGRTAAPGPMLGQHNEHVLRGILGMTDDEVAALVASGAIE